MTAAQTAPEALTFISAKRLTEKLRVALDVADDLLVQAFHGRAWEPLGYPTWAAYCEAELGNLRLIKLTTDELQARITIMRAAGMSTRGIAEALGVSKSKVHRHLPDEQPGEVISLDAKRRPSAGHRAERLPAPEGRVWQQAAEWLRRHPDGLTLAELAKAAHWSEGKASGALSDVRRRGLAVRTEDRRGGMRVHLAVQP